MIIFGSLQLTDSISWIQKFVHISYISELFSLYHILQSNIFIYKHKEL